MKYSYSNDDTRFSIDVIDEVAEEELDTLLNDSTPFFEISGEINDLDLDKEFVEFIEIKTDEIPKEEDEVDDNFEELKVDDQMRIKTSLEDLSIDLELKPLPDQLEYACLKKNSLLPVIISSLLKNDEK